MVKINDNDKEPERYYDWIGWKLRQERKKRMKNGKIEEEQARMQSDHLEIMDMVNHPPHYNQAGIEALDAILAATNEGSEYYLQGNILKYVWRYRYTTGRMFDEILDEVDKQKEIKYRDNVIEVDFGKDK